MAAEEGIGVMLAGDEIGWIAAEGDTVRTEEETGRSDSEGILQGRLLRWIGVRWLLRKRLERCLLVVRLHINQFC